MRRKGKICLTKNSILMTWLRTIGLLVCVSVLFGTLMYSITMKEYREKTDAAFALMNSQIKTALDSGIQDAQITLAKYTSDEAVQDLAISKHLNSGAPGARATQKMNIRNHLNSYVSTNNFVSDIYLYLEQHNYIISSTTAASAPILYLAYFTQYADNYEDWRRELFERDSGATFFVNRSNKDELCCVFVPAYGSQEVRACYFLSGGKIRSILKGLPLENGTYTALLLDDGSVFSCSDPAVWEEITGDIHSSWSTGVESGSGIIDLPARHGTVYVTKSDLLDVYFALYAPDNSEGFSSEALRILSVAGLCVLILLALLSSFQFVTRNYIPLLEIRDLVASGSIGRRNELSVIREAIEESQRNQASIAQKLELKSSMLENTFIQMLLQGVDIAKLGIEAYRQADIEFTFDCFCVMVFAIKNDFDAGLNDEQSVFLIVQANKNVSLLTGFIHQSRVLKMDGAIVLLVNTPQVQAEQWPETAGSVAGGIVQEWERNFDEPLIYSFGECYQGIQGISVSYREALTAVRYQIAHDSVERQDADQKPENIKYYYPPQEDNRMYNTLMFGSGSELHDQLDMLWKENEATEWRDITLDFLAADIAATGLRAYQNTGADPSMDKKLFFLLMQLSNAKKNDKRKTLLVSFLEVIQEECSRKQDISEEAFCEDILSYIRKNYADPELSIDRICSVFNRSRNYIYVAFKKVTGEGLLHHINLIRLEQAKELLKQPKMTVEKAAVLVGFNSSLTFTRCFKKYEGISPGKYITENIRKPPQK